MGTRPGPMPKQRPNNDWYIQANCYNIPHYLDDPDQGGYTDKQRKQICLGEKTEGKLIVETRCPVIDQCLEYAMSQPITDIAHRGLVYGGYTGSEIKKKIQQNRREGRV